MQLVMFPLPANIYTEIGAFLTSVICWNHIKSSRLRWLVPFLFLIVFVELSGRYIRKELHESNAWLYNISIPFEYMFYVFLFVPFYNKKIGKLAARFFLIAFPIWVVINIFFVQGFYNFNTNFLKIGSFCMIFFCFLVFLELLLSEEMINPFKQPIFWIASGLFIFNAGEFSYNTFADTMMKKWSYGKSLFGQINNNLIFVLYISIIIGITSSIWGQKEKK